MNHSGRIDGIWVDGVLVCDWEYPIHIGIAYFWPLLKRFKFREAIRALWFNNDTHRLIVWYARKSGLRRKEINTNRIQR